MRFFERLQRLMKVNESYDIAQYFLHKITDFHSVLFNCYALLALNDFELWQKKISVCCCTVSPLGIISKYFAIVKQKVICQILQVLIFSHPFRTQYFGPYQKTQTLAACFF
jgi:hypothetical protein